MSGARGRLLRRAIPPLSFEYEPIGWDMTVRAAPAEAVVDAELKGLSEPYRLIDLWPARGSPASFCEAGPAWLYKHNRGADLATAPRFERARVAAPRPDVTGLAEAAISFEDLDADGSKQVVAFGPQLGGTALGRDDAWSPALPQATNLDSAIPPSGAST
ncbi:MAG: hypothetical protein R2736_20335 [Solirubrobacterales bacterium]